MRLRPRSDRPVLDLPLSRWEWVLEVGAFVLVVVSLVIVVYYLQRLPDTVPHKFDADGRPVGYAARGNYLIGPILIVGLYTLLTVLGRFPHAFSYPNCVTPDNAAAMYRLGRLMVATLKIEVVGLLTWMSVQQARVALGTADTLGDWLPAFVGVMFFSVGVFVLLMRKL